MNKIYTRVLSCALLSTTIFTPLLTVKAQQQIASSSSRNIPLQTDDLNARIEAIIGKAEDHYRAGTIHLSANEFTQARERFDKAVEVILLSGLNASKNPKLEDYFNKLNTKIYRLEVGDYVALRNSDGQVEIKEKVAPRPNSPSDVVSSQVVGSETAKTDIQQVGFSSQTFESSPLDELAKLELTPIEEDVQTEEAQESIQQIEVAVKRGSLGFNFQVHPMVQQFINYYKGRGRTTMETGLQRSGQFTRMARRIFKEEGVPENMVWLGQVESAWKPWARSWAAASGLWQFIPGTGTRYGLRQTAYLDERHNYEKATRASARYLKFLADRYNGNWELAMAGYNSGEGNVDKAIRKAGAQNFWLAYPYLPQETRNYVPNILATILIANNPNNYGFGQVRPMQPLIYDKVRVPNSTNLSLIAQATDTSVEVIRYLNPDLRQNMTPPEPYVLLVPAGTANQLVATLRKIPSNSRNSAMLATVSAGEDLQTVANRTGMTVEQLQALNGNFDPKRGGKVVVSTTNNVNRIAYVRPRGNAPSSAPSGLQNIRAVAGDTITKIALKYGFAADDLARMNGVLPDAPLKPGQVIKIPRK